MDTETTTVYAVLNAGLMAGVLDRSVSPEQAKIASLWLALQESLENR